MKIARVLTDLSVDREFDYLVPAELEKRVHAGSRVLVPFGRGDHTRRGTVLGFRERPARPDVTLKPLHSVEGDREQIPPVLLRLARWMSEYYCCPREAAIRSILPAPVRGGKIRARKHRFACLAHPAAGTDAGTGPTLTKKQQAVLEVLVRLGSCPVSDLARAANVGPAVIRRLEEHGRITIEERAVARDPFADDVILPTSPLELTAHQQEALAVINRAVDASSGEVILLHGVTGSGKTEVYLQAIARCIESGREAIVLVPEIALTPQTCMRFRARFGDRVSVLHSGLSDGERFDEWTRIHEGKTMIAVGARSALFAPFRKPGLIVVDEEHESTYKQDEAPRYNARDVAVVRGRFEHATVVLGTATPSLETFYNCRAGRYRLAELPERVDGCRMPLMEVVDMAAEAAACGRPHIFSRRLQDQIRQRLECGEQTIIFLNRRGYATQFLCTTCGYVGECEDCSTAYTFHRQDGILCCHLCGHILPAPESCPKCSDPGVRYTGLGTEKVEAAAKALFPQATVGRMDSDTMTTRKSYTKMLTDFGGGRVQILIGTQMIAKGLHFPNVTLVGIVFADLGLHLPDFRAGERTFQLLTQVAGRAGRGEIPGRVIVQTYTPFHPALQCALEQNFTAFYEEEMVSREALGFPPVTHMILVHFRSEDEALARDTAEAFTADLAPHLDGETRRTGPMPAPIAKIRKFYRWQLLLWGGDTVRLVRILRRLVGARRYSGKVDIHVDVDPRSLM